MMKQLIENSKAFKSLDGLSQKFLNKRANRIQVEDAIIQARTIGVETWKAQSSLPNKWKKIVEEIITSEVCESI